MHSAALAAAVAAVAIQTIQNYTSLGNPYLDFLSFVLVCLLFALARLPILGRTNLRSRLCMSWLLSIEGSNRDTHNNNYCRLLTRKVVQRPGRTGTVVHRSIKRTADSGCSIKR